jgi:small subunit ribosomal protein S17
MSEEEKELEGETESGPAGPPADAKAGSRTRKGASAKGARTARAPTPGRACGKRRERRGVVVSNAMDKTIVVRVDSVRPHPQYKKVVKRSTKLHVHDERNEAGVGDVVRVVESRPLSKTKRWRLVEILEVAR